MDRTFHNRLGESVEIPEVTATQAKKTFDELLDGLLDRMQAPAAREGMEKAFNATPAELGRAAVMATRRRR
jgi:hypothetical protein